MKTNINNVDEYIAQCPVDRQKILNELRNLIIKSVPDAEECLLYKMPGYKLNGKTLVYFACRKDFIGFYPTGSGVSAFIDELSEFETTKGTIHIPYNKPLPKDLIKKIVKFKMEEVMKK